VTSDAPSSGRPLAGAIELAADRPTAIVRLVGVALVCVGVVHLVWPGRLLWTGQAAYGLALDVRFEPRQKARGRVRLVGAAMVVVGAHLVSRGGVFPAERDG
jgi:uncharacterized protein YjeT (DUF2065 family)